MTVVSSNILSKRLHDTGLFQDQQIEKLLSSARSEDSSVTSLVVQSGYAKEEEYLEALAGVLRTKFMRLADLEVGLEVLEMLPTKAVFQYEVIPVALERNVLEVAVNDPLKIGLMDALRLAVDGRVKFVLSTEEDIARAIKKFYGVGADTVERMIADDRFEVADAEGIGKVDLSEMDQEASIVKFVNQIIWEAHQQGATDIHFEPMEEQLRIRYRVDGILHQTPVPPQLIRFQAAIISRIKVMANLDIAEKRLPMDGRIGLRVKDRDIDIRVSTMPTVYGESVSLRLLQSGGDFVSLAELGMSERDSDLVLKVIHRPNGIVLVTGPTGSGKSTSLYAYLKEINNLDVRIMTAEDPIEYEMTGVNQVLVREDIGLTFATVLRAFLRQDPDIIMVGEIRDQETAEIAIQASLTGHLVFSTLHTNDSAGAFTRLLDMGVEPFLVASAVSAVVAQRLIRRLCKECRQEIEPDIEDLQQVGFPIKQLDTGGKIFNLQGCEKCRMSGFSGRGGIFEVLNVTDEIESLVINRSSMNAIQHQAIKQGMTVLRDDGWRKVLTGVTTVEEVLRVTEESD
ncbi:secretion system protein E [bacterium E08(2017)]|nr:secretion system protein E [bacterium E08(2017)]